MRKSKKCIICKKKYIPLRYYADIQHDIPHGGNNIEIIYLKCGKCPSCAKKCRDFLTETLDEEIYQALKKNPKQYACLLKDIKDLTNPLEFDADNIREFIECTNLFDNELCDGYGEIGDYINFYDIKEAKK